MLADSTRESVMILFTIAAAGVLGYMLSSLQITQEIATTIATLDVNGWVLMGFISLFLLVAGFFVLAIVILSVFPSLRRGCQMSSWEWLSPAVDQYRSEVAR